MENSTTYERATLAIGTVDYILAPAYGLVIVFGFAGNILVVLVVKRKRSMHTTTNYLLANLAAADLFTLAWCIPGLVMTFTLHPPGIVGDFLCKFVTMHHMAGISLLVSGLTLTILAVERYKALFYPLAERLTLTRKNVKFPIACVWVFSIAYVVPLFVTERFNETWKTCEILWPAQDEVLASEIYWGILAGIASLSFVIILYCYFNIIKGIYFTKTICGGSAESTQNARGSADVADKRKIVKLLLTVTVVFFVCFIPFCLVSVILLDVRYAAVYKLTYFLVYCSSSLNPFIYAFHSSNYREAFRGIIVDITEKFHCNLSKRWTSRCSNKMSDLELRATYHPSNDVLQVSPPEMQHQAKLLSFKRFEK